MRIDMHIHTRFSPCSKIRVRQIPRKIQEACIDGVCITDHNTTASRSLLKDISHVSGLSISSGLNMQQPRVISSFLARLNIFMRVWTLRHLSNGYKRKAA